MFKWMKTLKTKQKCIQSTFLFSQFGLFFSSQVLDPRVCGVCVCVLISQQIKPYNLWSLGSRLLGSRELGSLHVALGRYSGLKPSTIVCSSRGFSTFFWLIWTLAYDVHKHIQARAHVHTHTHNYISKRSPRYWEFYQYFSVAFLSWLVFDSCGSTTYEPCDLALSLRASSS